MNVQRNIILPVSCYNYCTRLHSGTDRMITSWWYDVRQPLSLLRNVMMLLIITITASKYSPLPQNLKCPLCTRMMNEYPPILFPGLSLKASRSSISTWFFLLSQCLLRLQHVMTLIWPLRFLPETASCVLFLPAMSTWLSFNDATVVVVVDDLVSTLSRRPGATDINSRWHHANFSARLWWLRGTPVNISGGDGNWTNSFQRVCPSDVHGRFA